MDITWRSAVTAVVVACHPSDVLCDGPGQVLHAALPSSSPSPPSIQGHVQSLLLAVAEHRDPSERTHGQTKILYTQPPITRLNG